jgi:Sir2 family
MGDPDDDFGHPTPMPKFQVEITRRSTSSDSDSVTSSTFSSSPSCAFAIEIPVSVRAQPLDCGRRSLPFEVVDLTLDNVASSESCSKTMDALYRAKRMIVVAGAGISVGAGIPDFRSQAGLFSTLKAETKFKPSGKALFDVSVYKVIRSTTALTIERRRNSIVQQNDSITAFLNLKGQSDALSHPAR